MTEKKVARKDANQMFDELKLYDVISFDIFDTAIYRKVDQPNDVFTIMASEMGHGDFLNVRKRAESVARERKTENSGTREVVLGEIYEILVKEYGIAKQWENRECQLELELTVANPYIYQLYKKLLNEHKKIVFMSDMYLPETTIKKILDKCGYVEYEALYLSNSYQLRKGDGTLQKKLREDYIGQRIIHIGDSENGDYKKSISAGIDAIWWQDARHLVPEDVTDNLSGSFYRAVINNNMHNGLWCNNIYFNHGFEVGGILVAGFCEHINKIVAQKGIDKVLFCARDCEVLHRIYNEYYKQCANEYIEISRYAIMGVTCERYLYDWAERFIFRYLRENRGKKTIETLLNEAGFAYLVDYLEDFDIEKYLFPCAIEEKIIKQFIYRHASVIKEHNEQNVIAAKKYFDAVVGDAEKILIVDIGWSGTCISALRYFLEKNLDKNIDFISGTILCTSRGKALTASVCDDSISAYIYSPFKNRELMNIIMPKEKSIIEQDLLHMPLEYLFTSMNASITEYIFDENNDVRFGRSLIEPQNKDEIKEIQKGIMEFVRVYTQYTEAYRSRLTISPYVAFAPFLKSIEDKEYSYEVYKNFAYDAMSAPYCRDALNNKFGQMFEISVDKNNIEDNYDNAILCVSPELPFTGAPRSLLRICKVAKQLGYNPVVWSTKNGPLISEYFANDIPVQIVTEKDLQREDIKNLLRKFKFAICNTIVTDAYVRECRKFMPVVWYVREASNIMDFCRNNKLRLETLNHSREVCCVSQYAAMALQKYVKHDIRIIHNSVEDETEYALNYQAGQGEKVKFVQFGTMEYRKGYDVLLAAYKSMPKVYREQSEMYFAGGFINSGTPFCAYLFREMQEEPNVHYLGIVKGEKNKIETLSSMDVVVVASRDESCSLVALEGAMLSKPLIVTENVGAKYVVSEDNGRVVRTADVECLKEAMMYMIDNKNNLSKMGEKSRNYYEQYAGMDSHIDNLAQLFEELTEKAKDYVFNDLEEINEVCETTRENDITQGIDVVVAIIGNASCEKETKDCFKSIMDQTYKPSKVVYWMIDNPLECADSSELLAELGQYELFEIKTAKSYLECLQCIFKDNSEYKSSPIILTDSKTFYDSNMIKVLIESYTRNPQAVFAMNVDLILANRKGALRNPDRWIYNYKVLLDIPSYQLIPDLYGGVLYPPNAIPEQAFDVAVSIEDSHRDMDMWLKFWSTYNNYPVVLPRNYCEYSRNNNDRNSKKIKCCKKTCDHLLEILSAKGIYSEIMNRIIKDRFL